MSWRPSLGAWPEAGRIHFRVWAPSTTAVAVVSWGDGRPARSFALERSADGTFRGESSDFRPGDLYGYCLDGEGPFPDPVSRYQPEGVHGPSRIVDPGSFAWSDPSWKGVSRDDLIIYELHVGTFSPEGTFAGAAARLPELARLGITAVELMPVADFPGRRNWGYDGVDLFAPARCYGTPDDLRRLVDTAHALGMAVLLDVVYNHFGPDGSYLARYSPAYLSDRHRTPWGPAVNLDGPGSEMVRAFFIENALHWIHEYHMDGLRLDATHSMVDEGPRHFLAELSARVREDGPDRPIHLIAEDHRNLAGMLRPESAGGWGLDGVWSDDFHHQLRRLLCGDDDGVYRDFAGTIPDLVTTLNRGWLFTGGYSIHRGKNRGTDPAGLPPRSFVFCIQNHDRIGNRAFGERLNHQVDAATFRAASALWLLAPQTPLLFMGQEWAASSPFLFLTDHEPELGERVREGRLREFRSYRAFQEAAALERIPDPQDETTFLASRLDWSECDREPHASTLRLYRALLALRREKLAFAAAHTAAFRAFSLDDDSLLLRYAIDQEQILVVCRLRGSGSVMAHPPDLESQSDASDWLVVLTTEDPQYVPEPKPPDIEPGWRSPLFHFQRPGAVVLKDRRERPLT
jgi:maltooligosyltrehalose trehalohydrolase